MDIFSFYMPTRLFFGHGSVKKLARARLPEGRGLIITGGTSTTRLGYVAKVADALAEAGHETMVYNKVQPNPTIEGVRECAALCRAENIAFVVGVGGGSSIDTAKAVAIMATNEGDWWDYIHGGTGGGKRIAKAGLPIVAIPTTAGTGTEADPFTVITNGEEKIGGGGEKCFPTISIVDPDFMMTVPPHLTAYQGFDALFHNTEVMMSNGVNILSETIALSAIENIAKYLPRAVKDGNDLEAREHIAYGSTMAGITMQLTSTTAQHSMEHAMSAYHHNLPHGAGLIMISVEFARYFIERHACDEQFVKMARVMGIPDADKPEDFITALLQLQKDCGVGDLKMSDYGITADECMTLAVNARETMGGLFLANPCPMSDEECAGIFEKAYR